MKSQIHRLHIIFVCASIQSYNIISILSDTTASAPSDEEDDDEVMEAEPQRDTGGTSPTIDANTTSSSNMNEAIEGCSEIMAKVNANAQGSDLRHKPYSPLREGSTDMPKKSDEIYSMSENDWELINSKLHCIRRILLDELLEYLPQLRHVGKYNRYSLK